MRVAFLGPQCSFSHDFVLANCGSCVEKSCTNFQEVLDLLTKNEADFAVIPLENSNAKTIKSAQLAILTRRDRVFVHDLDPHHVRLDLYSFVSVDEIAEVRSFEPVFAQTAHWLAANLPHAARATEGWQSTSDAVMSLHVTRGADKAAAIGSKSAVHYNVPTVAEDIQTEPNHTIFARIGRVRPNIEDGACALLAIENFTEQDAGVLSAVLANNGCVFTADWVIRDGDHNFGVFEVQSLQRTAVALERAINAIENGLRKCFLVGVYSGKTITELECDKHSV